MSDRPSPASAMAEFGMDVQLRALVVEDEPLATQRMVRLLSNFPNVTLVGAAENAGQALQIIASTRPNLLLLDVEMPGLSGFELLERLPGGYAPAVIFTTAFDAYATRAFTVSAADFLVKPTTRERLAHALIQAQRNISARKVEEKLQQLQQTVGELRRQLQKARADDDELWVRHSGELIRIPLRSIDWIEAEKDYVRIHNGSRSYLLHGMIGAFEHRLDPARFVRVHRSAIVQIDRLRAIKRWRDGSITAELADQTMIRVGRKYNGALRAALRLQSEREADSELTA